MNKIAMKELLALAMEECQEDFPSWTAKCVEALNEIVTDADPEKCCALYQQAFDLGNFKAPSEFIGVREAIWLFKRSRKHMRPVQSSSQDSTKGEESPAPAPTCQLEPKP